MLCVTLDGFVEGNGVVKNVRLIQEKIWKVVADFYKENTAFDVRHIRVLSCYI